MLSKLDDPYDPSSYENVSRDNEQGDVIGGIRDQMIIRPGVNSESSHCEVEYHGIDELIYSSSV